MRPEVLGAFVVRRVSKALYAQRSFTANLLIDETLFLPATHL